MNESAMRQYYGLLASGAAPPAWWKLIHLNEHTKVVRGSDGLKALKKKVKQWAETQVCVFF